MIGNVIAGAGMGAFAVAVNDAADIKQKNAFAELSNL